MYGQLPDSMYDRQIPEGPLPTAIQVLTACTSVITVCSAISSRNVSAYSCSADTDIQMLHANS